MKYIWKENNTNNLGHAWKHEWSRKNISTWKYSPTYQAHTPTVILKCKPKSGLSSRRQVVHPRPQTPQGESVAKPGTLLLIILSVVCKFDLQEVHNNLFNPLFKKNVRGHKHPREVDNSRNSSPNINHYIHSKYSQHPVLDNQCLINGRPPQAVPSPISRHINSGCITYQWSKHK